MKAQLNGPTLQLMQITVTFPRQRKANVVCGESNRLFTAESRDWVTLGIERFDGNFSPGGISVENERVAKKDE